MRIRFDETCWWTTKKLHLGERCSEKECSLLFVAKMRQKCTMLLLPIGTYRITVFGSEFDGVTFQLIEDTFALV